jgi:hypothetical protein
MWLDVMITPLPRQRVEYVLMAFNSTLRNSSSRSRRGNRKNSNSMQL